MNSNPCNIKFIHYLFFIFLTYFSASGNSGTKNDYPNFLILIADDAGMDFGCYGNFTIKTPNIDKLASNGILCENVFLTAPQCSPSRISILTGKYPHTTRTEDLHTPLPEGVKFISSYLKETGYFSGHTAKTHFGENGMNQFDWYSKNLMDFKSFIIESKNKPFFFWTGFHDPHRNYQEGAISVPHNPDDVIVRPNLVDDNRTRKDIALYYDEIARMDSVIGQYIEVLKDQKKLKNTYIIFLSDNGAPFPREKGTLYDTGIKTPFIITGPDISENEVYDGLLSVIDLAPTILDIASIKKPIDMPGNSFSPLFHGDFQLATDYVFSERNWHNCDEHMRSIRSDRYKLIFNNYTEKPHGTAADLSNSLSWYSLIEGKENGGLTEAQQSIFIVPRPSVELYDLKTDPSEYNNLAFNPKYRQTAGMLLNELHQWMKNTDDFPPTKRTRRDNTDRITGIKYSFEIPELENDLEENTLALDSLE